MGMPHTAKRWTAAMVRALPDDNYRYEVIAGELVVTPAPSATHQRAVTGLLVRLANYLQHEKWAEVLASPADISFHADMLVQPDLFVLPITPGEGRVLGWSQIRTLLLAVEVLSTSTARADRQVKRRLYQQERVGEYWIVDVDARIGEGWRATERGPQVGRTRLSGLPGAAPGACAAKPRRRRPRSRVRRHERARRRSCRRGGRC